VYVPPVETVIVEDVAPVDQVLFVGYDELKSTVVPEHIVVDPDGVITGVAGGVLTETVLYTLA
jgi:hypothetical protein